MKSESNFIFIIVGAADLVSGGSTLNKLLKGTRLVGREVRLMVTEPLEPALLASLVRAMGVLRESRCSSVCIGAPALVYEQLQALGLGGFLERGPRTAAVAAAYAA